MTPGQLERWRPPPMSRFEGALSSIERHDRASRGTAGDHRMDLRIHLEDVKEPDAV